VTLPCTFGTATYSGTSVGIGSLCELLMCAGGFVSSLNKHISPGAAKSDRAAKLEKMAAARTVMQCACHTCGRAGSAVCSSGPGTVAPPSAVHPRHGVRPVQSPAGRAIDTRGM